jgi:hypothetical protein
VLPVDPSSPSFVSAASIDRVAGLPTSALSQLSFVVQDPPVGIDPCWKVTYVDPSGNTRVSRTPASADFARSTDLGFPNGPAGGHWTQWTFAVPAVQGTLTSVELEVHISQPPPVNDRVIFDNIGVNDQTFTFAGDANPPPTGD